MKIVKKAYMNDGTLIRIEDWSSNYTIFNKNDTIAAYPVAKKDSGRYFGPKKGETFRVDFKFPNGYETELAFNKLVKGIKTLNDYKKYNRNTFYNDYF